jgi:hypothetical protein
MNQAHFFQMSQKRLFDSKWRIKIRFFDVTLRVSNIFSIAKKVCQKIQDGGSNDFYNSAAILEFLTINNFNLKQL